MRTKSIIFSVGWGHPEKMPDAPSVVRSSMCAGRVAWEFIQIDECNLIFFEK